MKVEERKYFHRLKANKNKKVLKENLMVISLNNGIKSHRNEGEGKVET